MILARVKPAVPHVQQTSSCHLNRVQNKKAAVVELFMANSKILAVTRAELIRISDPLRQKLTEIQYETPPGDQISVKSLIESLLPASLNVIEALEVEETKKFCLFCAAIASAEGEETPHLYWISKDLSFGARIALKELSNSLNFAGENEFMCDLIRVLVPYLKDVVKESGIDLGDDEIVANSAKSPVVYAIVAAHQFRWLVSQVGFPYLGELCPLIIPCALTALDHWSPEVKAPGMMSFIHLAKNVNSTELAWYDEPILDACCRNVASSDELWDRAVEMSVILLTHIQRGNPRSPWYGQIFGEMLGHLERHPMNKDQRASWLHHIDPILKTMGLFLLLHFRRLFPLLFQWLHANDDETLILVLDRIYTIAKVTWPRKSPFILRLVDELIPVFKLASMRKEREAIRSRIIQIFSLLRSCHGPEFEIAWERHKDNPDLAQLSSSIT